MGSVEGIISESLCFSSSLSIYFLHNVRKKIVEFVFHTCNLYSFITGSQANLGGMRDAAN